MNIDGSTYNNVKTSTSSWSADEWYCVAVAWDGTDFQVYVDGALENEVTHSGTHAAQAGLNMAKHAQDNDYFQGAIDEVRIYGRELDYQEIQWLYCNPFRGDANSDGETTIGDVVLWRSQLGLGDRRRRYRLPRQLSIQKRSAANQACPIVGMSTGLQLESLG